VWERKGTWCGAADLVKKNRKQKKKGGTLEKKERMSFTRLKKEGNSLSIHRKRQGMAEIKGKLKRQTGGVCR